MKPKYGSERAFELANPLLLDEFYRVPPIVCPVCRQWGAIYAFRMPLTEAVRRIGTAPPLPVEEWRKQSVVWARELGIPSESLEPGLEIGPAHGAFRRVPKYDFVFPDLGPCWVNERVRAAMEANAVTGGRFDAGAVRLAKGSGPMFEWIFEKNAWRLGHTAKSVRACDICHRAEFPDPDRLVVDLARWDGSDCFYLETNQFMRVITERVANIIREHAFTNVRLAPIQSSEDVLN